MPIITDFDALNDTRLAKVTLIHGRRSDPFVSWIDADFTVTGSADYTSPFEDLFQSHIETVENVKAGGQLANLDAIPFIGSLFRKTETLKNARFTASRWSASQKPQFEVPMIFITLDSKSNVMRKARDLASLVYPEIDGKGFLGAPGGYQFSASFVENVSRAVTESQSQDRQSQIKSAFDAFNYKDLAIEGGWTVEIGGYFRAENLLLVNTNLTLSKERTRYGPLTAKVDCTFEPFRLISSREYRNYFIDSVVPPITHPNTGLSLISNSASTPQQNVQEARTVTESIRSESQERPDPYNELYNRYRDSRQFYEKGRRFKLELDRYFG